MGISLDNISNTKMNITEINNTKNANLIYQRFVPYTLEQAKVKDIRSDRQSQIVDKNDVKTPPNWKQSILLQGLETLSNKIQMENNTIYVLDKPENAPIEKFEEAISELKLLNSELFVKYALQAQANISPKVVFELLTEV